MWPGGTSSLHMKVSTQTYKQTNTQTNKIKTLKWGSVISSGGTPAELSHQRSLKLQSLCGENMAGRNFFISYEGVHTNKQTISKL